MGIRQTERASGEKGLLLQIVDEAYEKKAWHGPNLRGALRGISPAQAAWKPSLHRHSIWELIRHAAYWKYAARRRLLGEKRGAFPIKGSNWFEVPLSPTPEAWRKELALLHQMHTSLREAIARTSTRNLWKIPAGSRIEHARVIYGIALHDVYHAGQIQLLKRLQGKG